MANDLPSTSPTRRPYTLAVLALVAAAAVPAAYAAFVGAHLLSDDWGLFSKAGSLADVVADFARPWMTYANCYYRPLATASLALDQALFGLEPLPFHLTSLAVLLAAAVLCALLARRLAPRNPGPAGLVAFTVCVLHPVAVEPAAWICCRGTVLSGFFFLLGCLAAMRFVAGGGGAALAGAVLAHVAALLSKEDGLTLPVVVMVLTAARGRLRRAASVFGLMAVVTGAYFLLRHFLGIRFAGGDHDALLRPDMWRPAADLLGGHLSLLFAPHFTSPLFLSIEGTVAVVTGFGVLLILGIRQLAGAAFWRVAVAVLLCLGPAMPAHIDLVHGSRVLFQPLLMTAVLVGVLAAGVARGGSVLRWGPVAVAAAGLAMLSLVALRIWREAGDLSMRVATSVQALHAARPPAEDFIFVDPPRFHRGVPVLDQATASLLEPPFVTRPRRLVTAFRDLAEETLNAPSATRPSRVIQWRGGGEVYDAAAPAFTSPVLREWTGAALHEWKPAATAEGVVLASPALSVTPLVVNRVEIDLAAASFQGRVTLSFEPRAGASAAEFEVRGEPLATGGCRLWLPLARVPGLAEVTRLEGVRVVVGGSSLSLHDVKAVRLMRRLPEMAMTAAMREEADSVVLDVRLRLPEGLVPERFRLQFYRLRDPLTVMDVPRAEWQRAVDGRLQLLRPIPRVRLRELGIRSGTDLFARVEAYVGEMSSLTLRARSRPAGIKVP